MEKRLTCECGHEIAVRPESSATSLDCPACGRELRIAPDPPEQPDPPAQPPVSERAPCPYCLERIKPGARKCPFCQEYLDASAAPRPAPPPAPQPRTSGLAIASLVLALAAPFLCFATAVPAVLVGIGAIAATRAPQVRGKAMAIVAILLGLLFTATAVALFLMIGRIGDGGPLDIGPPANDFLF